MTEVGLLREGKKSKINTAFKRKTRAGGKGRALSETLVVWHRCRDAER